MTSCEQIPVKMQFIVGLSFSLLCRGWGRGVGLISQLSGNNVTLLQYSTVHGKNILCMPHGCEIISVYI
jgi:hypothetical protein